MTWNINNKCFKVSTVGKHTYSYSTFQDRVQLNRLLYSDPDVMILFYFALMIRAIYLKACIVYLCCQFYTQHSEKFLGCAVPHVLPTAFVASIMWHHQLQIQALPSGPVQISWTTCLVKSRLVAAVTCVLDASTQAIGPTHLGSVRLHLCMLCHESSHLQHVNQVAGAPPSCSVLLLKRITKSSHGPGMHWLWRCFDHCCRCVHLWQHKLQPLQCLRSMGKSCHIVFAFASCLHNLQCCSGWGFTKQIMDRMNVNRYLKSSADVRLTKASILGYLSIVMIDYPAAPECDSRSEASMS